MLDQAAITMERVRGEARLALGPEGLKTLYQAGSAKVMLPRTDAACPEVVFLNTAGGLTGGDRLSYRCEIGADAVVTTRTAERAYAARGGEASVTLDFRVTGGAVLHWLPQETILFDGSALRRETTIALEGGAEVLMAEIIVLGRRAMGERVGRLSFRDRREIRRDGRLVHLESLDPGSVAARWQPAATLGGRAVFATLVMTGAALDGRLAGLRPLLTDDAVDAAASAYDGRLVLRALAPDLFPLKRLMARAITHLTRAPLPRVWQI